jgi:hypothetical protein
MDDQRIDRNGRRRIAARTKRALYVVFGLFFATLFIAAAFLEYDSWKIKAGVLILFATCTIIFLVVARFVRDEDLPWPMP